jgi:23S rRNA pseudouridine1911/1915/1917 synthase
VRWTVPDDLDGERADKVVATLAGISRSAARGLVESGGVLGPSGALTPRDRLAAGDEVEFDVPEARPLLVAEDVAVDVVHEDPSYLVVDKPPGMVVHPGAGRSGGTLASGLLHRHPELEGVGEPDRWGIVHRLDRDTSGLLVVARTADAHRVLSRAIARREVHRGYRALTVGTFRIPRGTIDAPIAADPRRPTRRIVQADGRPSVTHYEVESTWSGARVSFLAVTLETGRTHQIRVHLASIDHPVIGDRVYGRPWTVDAPRVFLHAAELSFAHPVTGERVSYRSALPADLQGVLDGLGSPD